MTIRIAIMRQEQRCQGAKGFCRLLLGHRKSLGDASPRQQQQQQQQSGKMLKETQQNELAQLLQSSASLTATGIMGDTWIHSRWEAHVHTHREKHASLLMRRNEMLCVGNTLNPCAWLFVNLFYRPVVRLRRRGGGADADAPLLFFLFISISISDTFRPVKNT